MKIHFVRESANSKTGKIPVTYSQRGTCPPSCPHYRLDCYAEDYYTRMVWDKVPQRGGTLSALCKSIAKLPDGQLWRFNVAGDLPGFRENLDKNALRQIVTANMGKRGFTYTHKHGRNVIKAAKEATSKGFVINLSADDAGHADRLARHGLPVVCIVPMDTPAKSATPEGREIRVCPAQLRNTTCDACELCSRPARAVIVGFRAHGGRAKIADKRARKVIPIASAKC